jgi:hypothetical protein
MIDKPSIPALSSSIAQALDPELSEKCEYRQVNETVDTPCGMEPSPAE